MQASGGHRSLKVSHAGYIADGLFFSDLDRNNFFSRAAERAVASSELGDLDAAAPFGPDTLAVAIIQAYVGGTDSLTGSSAPYIRFRAPAGPAPECCGQPSFW